MSAISCVAIGHLICIFEPVGLVWSCQDAVITGKEVRAQNHFKSEHQKHFGTMAAHRTFRRVAEIRSYGVSRICMFELEMSVGSNLK